MMKKLQVFGTIRLKLKINVVGSPNGEKTKERKTKKKRTEINDNRFWF